jgi:hypothetical protein
MRRTFAAALLELVQDLCQSRNKQHQAALSCLLVHPAGLEPATF